MIAHLSPTADELKYHLEPSLRASYAMLEASQIKSMLADLTYEQPKLDTQLDPISMEARFGYRARHIRFTGRDKEMSALKSFLSATKQNAATDFSWQLVHGPGGIGKSRLALELLIQCAGAYQAGFLSNQEAKIFDWQRWKPERPTLLIIDYAATDTNAVSNLLESLSIRTDLDWPVRLLLLERTGSGPWIDTIRRVGHSAQYRVKKAIYAEPEADKTEKIGLELKPIEDMWPLMLDPFQKAGFTPPDRDETLGTLMDIDELQRPLYAAFLADAIICGKLPRQWDRERLLSDVLAYEKNHYWCNSKGFSKRHELLIVFCTMVEGLGFDAIRKIIEDDTDEIFPRWSLLELPKDLAGVYGYTPQEKLSALEPDLLGEVLVLEYLQAEPGFTSLLRDKAWHENPLHFASFLDRLSSALGVSIALCK